MKWTSIWVCFSIGVVLLTFSPVAAYQDNVGEGSFATYEFSASVCGTNIEWLQAEGTIGWQCIERDGDVARMRQWMEVTFPKEYYDQSVEKILDNPILFVGEDIYNLALAGDYSFIPHFAPEDFELADSWAPDGQYVKEYGIKLYVHGTHYYEMTVDVDLRTREVYALDGNVIGRWLWWINPEQYPLEGQTDEVYRHDWYGQQINGFVSYYSEDTYENWGLIFENRFKGSVTELYSLGQKISSYEPVLIGGEPLYFSAGIQYDISSGMPIWPYGVGLCDDVTALMTGLEFTPVVY